MSMWEGGVFWCGGILGFDLSNRSWFDFNYRDLFKHISIFFKHFTILLKPYILHKGKPNIICLETVLYCSAIFKSNNMSNKNLNVFIKQ